MHVPSIIGIIIILVIAGGVLVYTKKMIDEITEIRYGSLMEIAK